MQNASSMSRRHPLLLSAFSSSRAQQKAPTEQSHRRALLFSLSRGPNGAEMRSSSVRVRAQRSRAGLLMPAHGLAQDGVWQADAGPSLPCAVQQHAPRRRHGRTRRRATAAAAAIPCYSVHCTGISASGTSTPGERFEGASGGRDSSWRARAVMHTINTHSDDSVMSPSHNMHYQLSDFPPLLPRRSRRPRRPRLWLRATGAAAT